MERTYFSINEDAARLSKEMMSFSEYKEGSKTAEYRRMCDETYELADRAIEARPEEEERIERLAVRYARKLADNMNKDSDIGGRCPFVMISGSANFPVKKKEKQLEAWEKNQQEFSQIQGIRDQIRRIINGKDVIKSDDQNAIEKLEKKIEKMEELQEMMKEANKAIRMKDTEKGDARLRELGYSDADIKNLREPDFCGRVGYPSFALQNNNQNIRSSKERLERLKKEKEQGTSEMECEFFRVQENAEDMRIRLFFDGKPEPEVRDILKSHGFKFSPKNMAWQRMLNNNGRYAVKQVISRLREAQAV